MLAQNLSTANRGDNPKKLMEQVRDVLRLKHYSLRTERSYCDWIERFIRFHQLRHPKEMGEAEVSSFLTQLARRLRIVIGCIGFVGSTRFSETTAVLR